MQPQSEAPFVEHRVALPDGRRVVAAEYGQRSVLPIVYIHGFLGSRFEPRAAGALGRNLIAADRPGYGGSMPMPVPSLAVFAHDLELLLDRLGVGRCGIVGVSAGAPYAVAAAARLGGRVAAVVLAAGVGDRHAILAGGGSVKLFERFQRHRRLLATVMPRVVRQARHHGLDARFVRLVLREEVARFALDVDQPGLARRLLGSMREGLRPGLAGVLTDIDLLTRDWGVSPASIRVPTLVLHGDKDRVVPVSHGRWYARNIEAARLEVVPAHGHISLVVNQASRILGIFDEAT